jgi:hypothetical protein
MSMRALAATTAAAFALGCVIAQPAEAQQKSKENGKSAGKSTKRVVQGPTLRHKCQVGPYEKQTRLVMETVKDKPVYIAYWSSNGPFHCSFETWPGDGRAKWVDEAKRTVINLISGSMHIERNGDKYFIHARDVDRMPYCGTFGLITGTLTVPKKGPCDWKEMPSSSDAAADAPAEAPAATEPAKDAQPGSTSAGVRAGDPG